jgi:hypothetical protein
MRFCLVFVLAIAVQNSRQKNIKSEPTISGILALNYYGFKPVVKIEIIELFDVSVQ